MSRPPPSTRDQLAQAATFFQSGMSLALPVDYAGVSMALTWPLLASGTKDFDLVCVPTGGLQADILIGAGRVRSIETSAMTLGEAGGAPCFNRAVREGSIVIRDATCPAIHAGLQAAQRGAPFTAMRGLLGTDVLAQRNDWRVIDNPFSDAPDPVVLIPAIRPDLALFHCPLGDRQGNVWIGRRRELATMAYAARRSLVTVERLVDDLFATEETAAGTLPALYVDQVIEVPQGARPYGLWGVYGGDLPALKRYAAEARTPEGFAAWLEEAQAEAAGIRGGAP
ncbi:CoA transferase subunit A [Aquibaculum arenosum]|uniref:CoA synthetase n=1 Tax=Aquibaculum arenosum TaxID=3032591 RepID=A0ABT5YNG0_9PROT|nr:CoA-transferase [Fodinicurvata sp. CAU 1616]MDF2096404.1 CoA synthetase [Fodinicurvata sp. CAU 1616]